MTYQPRTFLGRFVADVVLRVRAVKQSATDGELEELGDNLRERLEWLRELSPFLSFHPAGAAVAAAVQQLYDWDDEAPEPPALPYQVQPDGVGAVVWWRDTNFHWGPRGILIGWEGRGLNRLPDAIVLLSDGGLDKRAGGDIRVQHPGVHVLRVLRAADVEERSDA